MRKKSLREVLFYRIILLVIIPMFIISYLSVYISVSGIKESIEKRNTAIRNVFNYSIDNYEKSIFLIGNLLIDNFIKNSEKNHDLKVIKKINHNFKKIQILDLEGIIRYSSEEGEYLGLDMSNFEFIEKAITQKGVFWSKVMKSFEDQSPEIMVAKRFGSEILVGSIDLEELNNLVKDIVKNTGSKVAILDRSGDIIIDNLKGLTPQKNSFIYDYVYKSKNQEIKKRSFIKDRTKLDIIQSYKKIDKTGWDIIIIEEASKGFLLAWDFYRHLVLGISLFTLGIIYLSSLVISKFTEDIKKLKIISKKVSLGELPENLEYEILETEELANKFLLMGKVVFEREKKINEKGIFLENLLYTIPIPTFYQDKKGRYTNCNKAFEEIVDKKKIDIIGKDHLEVWGNNFTDQCNSKDEELFREKNLQKFEYNIIDKDSQKRILIFNKTVFYNEEGQVGGIIGVISDITEIRKMQRELKSLSLKDSLTSIYNRRGFEEISNISLKESIKNKNKVSIIMIDIDNFKLYNDNYGHQAGDKCLKKIARKLEESCMKPSNVVARYGGEEFIVFLPNTDLDEAKIVAKKINKNIQEMKIDHIESKHEKVVTVSIGVASNIPKDERSLEKLTGLADKMLYKAKERGRNRVEG